VGQRFDITGDGKDDLFWASSPNRFTGGDDWALNFIFGRSPWGGPYQLNNSGGPYGVLDGVQGVSIYIPHDFTWTYGDINGDGINDLIVAIPTLNGNTGEVIVSFGHPAGQWNCSLSNYACWGGSVLSVTS
jgi:hypothetical protein